MKKRIAFAALLFLAAAVVVGCAKRPEGLPELYPTEITVTTADGTPIANAFVKVASLEQPINFTIGGTTDGSGVAVMRAQLPTGDFVGAPAGKLKVTVSKSLKVTTGDGADDYTTVEVISADYQNINKTPLEIDIQTTGENKATLQCEANPEHADKVAQ